MYHKLTGKTNIRIGQLQYKIYDMYLYTNTFCNLTNWKRTSCRVLKYLLIWTAVEAHDHQMSSTNCVIKKLV